MQRMSDLERLKADRAIRLVVRGHLTKVCAALTTLVKGLEPAAPHEDPEALHALRVALRRLAAALRAFERFLPAARAQRRRLRRLASVPNAARHLEVERAWLGGLESVPGISLAKLRRRLERRRARESERALRKLARHLPDLLGRIEQALGGSARRLPPEVGFGPVLAGFARLQAARLKCRLEAARLDSGELSDEALHRARIDAKRMRYLLEPVARFSPETKALIQRCASLQDDLGDIHDRQVFASQAVRRAKHAKVPGPSHRWLERRALEELAQRKWELAERWLAPRGALEALLVETEQVSRALESVSDTEVERKYLLNGLPEGLRRDASKEILQGWIPGERIHERLRRIESAEGQVSHRRTLKLGRGLSRVEIEKALDADLFQRMWPLTQGKRVHKRRYVFEQQGLVWEVDEFLDRELFLAEVELPSPRIRPPIPAWLTSHLVREVTGESGYVNLLLAR
jgi:CHAD domain-containing protein/CYTH domain-containing protein